MAMNRQTRRLLQKQGEMADDGTVTPQKRQPPQQRAPKEERTSPGQFIREVRGELRKVAWPTRSEVVNYSIVVLITVIIVTALIAGLDFVLGEGVLRLYDTS